MDQKNEDELEPESEESEYGKCPKCGCRELISGYGLAFGRGIGAYLACNNCDWFEKGLDPELYTEEKMKQETPGPICGTVAMHDELNTEIAKVYTFFLAKIEKGDYAALEHYFAKQIARIESGWKVPVSVLLAPLSITVVVKANLGEVRKRYFECVKKELIAFRHPDIDRLLEGLE